MFQVGDMVLISQATQHLYGFFGKVTQILANNEFWGQLVEVEFGIEFCDPPMKFNFFENELTKIESTDIFDWSGEAYDT